MSNKNQIDSNTSLLDLSSQIDKFTNYLRVVQEICYELVSDTLHITGQYLYSTAKTRSNDLFF